MAHSTLIRAAGWAFGTAFMGAELETLDATLFASINGTAGGTWAPAAQIILDGSGLRVVGACSLANVGDSSLTGSDPTYIPYAFDAALGVLQVSNGNSVSFSSGAHRALLDGSTWTMAGNASHTLSGTATIALTASSSLTMGRTATASLNGPTTLGAAATVTYDTHASVVSGEQTFPTGFTGGEALTIGIADTSTDPVTTLVSVTLNFAASDQTQAAVMSRINAAVGYAFASSETATTMRFTASALATSITLNTSVSQPTLASTLATLGLTLGTYQGPAENYGGVTASGTQTRTGATILKTFTGGGSVSAIGWRFSSLSDATQNVDGGALDIAFIPAALGANRTYTLTVPINNLPARTIFSRVGSSAFSAIIANGGGGGGTIVTLTPGADPWCEVRFDGTNWKYVASGTGI